MKSAFDRFNASLKEGALKADKQTGDEILLRLDQANAAGHTGVQLSSYSKLALGIEQPEAQRC